MSKSVVNIQLDFESSLRLSSALAKDFDTDEIIFDFSNIRRVEPFALLMVSSQIRRFQAKYPDKKISYRHYQPLSYAKHMGFFNAFGLESSVPHRGDKSGKSYIPIEILDCKEIEDAAYDKGIEVGDEVETVCKKMAVVLSGESSGDLYDYLTYSFRELVRNVVEHSESSQVGYCAQYWPTKGRVELAIVDRGIGLMASLKNN